MPKLDPTIKRFYESRINALFRPNKVDGRDLIWLCNKASNKFTQLSRRYSIDPDSFKVSTLESSRGRFNNSDLLFRLENKLTGNVYLMSFAKFL